MKRAKDCEHVPFSIPDQIVDLVLKATDNSKLSDVASFHVDITEGEPMMIVARLRGYKNRDVEVWVESPNNDGTFQLIRRQ